jgi:hypothetical protein
MPDRAALVAHGVGAEIVFQRPGEGALRKFSA